jgi:uncharacterized protein
MSALRGAVRNFEGLVEELHAVEVTERVLRRAGALAQSLHLRGYDAVHLASAELVQDGDLVVAAGDGVLRRAAQELGLSVANLTSP